MSSFQDLLTKTDGATWFEKVREGDGRAAHLLLREHYVSEAHGMHWAAAANAKLESLVGGGVLATRVTALEGVDKPSIS